MKIIKNWNGEKTTNFVCHLDNGTNVELVNVPKKIVSDRTYTWVKDMGTSRLLYLMGHAKDHHQEELFKICVDELIQLGAVTNVVNHITNLYYGRYGCNELRFIYTRYSLDEIREITRGLARNLFLEKFDTSKLYLDENAESSSTTRILNSFLTVRLRESYQKWLVREVSDEFPNLTYCTLHKYCQLRKDTEYTFSLTKSDEEIYQIWKQYSVNAGPITLFNLKKAFNYPTNEVEAHVAKIREERAALANEKKRMRNQFLFWKKTSADKIDDSEYFRFVEDIGTLLNWPHSFSSYLYNWFLVCKYDGTQKKIAEPSQEMREYYNGINKSANTVFQRLKREALQKGEEYNLNPAILSLLEKTITGRLLKREQEKSN